MGDIQHLKNALQWAINNPDLHDQSDSDLCIVGHYMYGREYYNGTPISFAELTGISIRDARQLYAIENDFKAIQFAKELIDKYSPSTTQSNDNITVRWGGVHTRTFEDENMAKVFAQGLSEGGETDIEVGRFTPIDWK